MEGSDLIEAINANQVDRAKELAFDKKILKTPDFMGFTPFLLAHYLNRIDILEFLDPKRKEKRFNVEGKSLTIEEFESFFNITYLSHLYFFTYDYLKHVVHCCPMEFKSQVFGLSERKTFAKYEFEITQGCTAPIEIRFINDRIGWGLFATKKILKKEFVIEYTGIVEKVMANFFPITPYTLRYPKSIFSLHLFMVNAEKGGNESRFINHSYHPNLKLKVANDHNLLHTLFVAARDIEPGEQLTFNYGKKYWTNRTPEDL